MTPDVDDAGWHRSDVEVRHAGDDGDGSGAERIEYTLGGAVSDTGAFDGEAGTLTIDALLTLLFGQLGERTYELHDIAEDRAGNEAACVATVTAPRHRR